MMAGEHFIERCRECKRVLNQCRCIGPHKDERWGLCIHCARKLAEASEQSAHTEHIRVGTAEAFDGGPDIVAPLPHERLNR